MFGKSLPHLYATSITDNPSDLLSQNVLVTWMDKITRHKPLGFATRSEHLWGIMQNKRVLADSESQVVAQP